MFNIHIKQAIDTDETRLVGEQHRSRIEYLDKEALGPWESEVDAIERLKTAARNIKKALEKEIPGCTVKILPFKLGPKQYDTF